MTTGLEFIGRDRVREVRDEGRVVVLENGSRWEIPDADDRRKVANWEQGEVWVTQDKFGEGDFMLAPGSHDEAVNGRFAGTDEASR